MTPRLQRALQRGGVTAMLRTDCWGVRRTRDRRGRMIGTVSGADIDLLRLRNCLKPLGGATPVTLIWAGPVAATPSSVPDVNAIEPSRPARTMLDLILRDRISAEQREPIREACQLYLADLDQISSASTHVTMNWDRLAIAERSKHRPPSSPSSSARDDRSARTRLNALAIAMSHEDLEFLEALVLREASRPALARRFSLRLAYVDRRSLSVLRTLIEVYKGQTKRVT